MKTIEIDGVVYACTPIFEIKQSEQPKLAQTIEEVNEALRPDWFANNYVENYSTKLKGNVTTKADSLRVIAFRDLLNLVAYCNKRFERDVNRNVWSVFANKNAYVASGESPIVFNSRKAMEYARDTFWPIFQQWFTGEEQK